MRERIICTKEKPWDGKAQVVHADAKEGAQHDGWPAGDTVDMRCPHCGHEWTMELPQ